MSSAAAELSKLLEGRVDLVQHIGSYVEARHYDCCYSAFMISDQLFRQCPPNGIIHKQQERFLEQLRLPAPMSYIFDNETQNFDPASIPPKAYMKNSYNAFCQQMTRFGGDTTTCDDYTLFQRKTYTGRMVVRHIAQLMQERCGKVSVSKVHQGWLKVIPFLHIYLQENIRTRHLIEKNITHQDVTMILTNQVTAPEFWMKKYLELHQSLLSENDVMLLQSIGAGGRTDKIGFDQISEGSDSSDDKLPGYSSNSIEKKSGGGDGRVLMMLMTMEVFQSPLKTLTTHLTNLILVWTQLLTVTIRHPVRNLGFLVRIQLWQQIIHI